MARLHYVACMDGHSIIGLWHPRSDHPIAAPYDIPTAERMLLMHRRSAWEQAELGACEALANSFLECADELEAALKDAERQRETMAAIAA